MRPLFRVSVARDLPMGEMHARVVPFNNLDVGHVDYYYRVGGQPAVRFEPVPSHAPTPNEYMQIGHAGYWPRVKVRYALIATPAGAQPIYAALQRHGPPGPMLGPSRSGAPRSPGHFFLEGEGYLQAGPGVGVNLYVEGADTIVAGSYVEISEAPPARRAVSM